MNLQGKSNEYFIVDKEYHGFCFLFYKFEIAKVKK